MMIVYSKMVKGREIREHVMINSLEASVVSKESNMGGNKRVNWISIYRKAGYEIIYQLRSGMMVLLYENECDEIWELDKSHLQKRLYVITKMKGDGRIYMIHHQEAREKKYLEEKSGAYKTNEQFRPLIVTSCKQFKALVQGVDFEINDLGEITRLI